MSHKYDQWYFGCSGDCKLVKEYHKMKTQIHVGRWWTIKNTLISFDHIFPCLSFLAYAKSPQLIEIENKFRKNQNNHININVKKDSNEAKNHWFVNRF